MGKGKENRTNSAYEVLDWHPRSEVKAVDTGHGIWGFGFSGQMVAVKCNPIGLWLVKAIQEAEEQPVVNGIGVWPVRKKENHLIKEKLLFHFENYLGSDGAEGPAKAAFGSPSGSCLGMYDETRRFSINGKK